MPGVRCRRLRSRPSTCASSSVDEWSRPDEAHLATQDVEDLRELIQRRAAQEPPDPGDAWVVGDLEQPVTGLVQRSQLVLVRLGVGDHRPELEDPEVLPVSADSDLTEEDRALRVESDRQRDHRR